MTKTKDSFEESGTQVRDLEVGDIIPGLDSNKKETPCIVKAIGNFRTDNVYGNYTFDCSFYIYENDIIERNGVDGDKLKETDKYDLITNCPVVKDRSIKFFGSMDSNFCDGRVKISVGRIISISIRQSFMWSASLAVSGYIILLY